MIMALLLCSTWVGAQEITGGIKIARGWDAIATAPTEKPGIEIGATIQIMPDNGYIRFKSGDGWTDWYKLSKAEATGLLKSGGLTPADTAIPACVIDSVMALSDKGGAIVPGTGLSAGAWVTYGRLTPPASGVLHTDSARTLSSNGWVTLYRNSATGRWERFDPVTKTYKETPLK